MRDAFVFESQPFQLEQGAYDPRGSHTCSCKKDRRANTRPESEVYQPLRPDGVDRFSGPEHQSTGDLAFGKLPTTIVYDEKGATLTFGEVIALAGDLFDDYFQMKELARTPGGRAELRWALWYAMNEKGPEPANVPEATKTKVKENYLALASRNISHFLTGGTAWATYFKWHSMAMVQAVDAGMESNEKTWREALSKEAFALHFLTDSFSSGHVRTPRKEMDEWYAQRYSHAIKRFVDKFATFMYGELKKRNRELRYPGVIPFLHLLPKYFTERGARADLGREIKKFSMDDPIALALHDLDNEKGLPVISAVDPNGKPVKGGFKWFAFGDGKLGEPSPYSKQPETRKMVVSAVKASLNELKVLRAAGARNKGRQFSHSGKIDMMKKALGIKPGLWNKSAAALYLPKEDKTRSSKPLEWRWGQLDPAVYQRVDRYVKTVFAKSFFDKARTSPTSTKALKVLNIGGTRDALNAFGTMLQTKGITFLEELVGKAR